MKTFLLFFGTTLVILNLGVVALTSHYETHTPQYALVAMGAFCVVVGLLL